MPGSGAGPVSTEEGKPSLVPPSLATPASDVELPSDAVEASGDRASAIRGTSCRAVGPSSVPSGMASNWLCDAGGLAIFPQAPVKRPAATNQRTEPEWKDFV